MSEQQQPTGWELKRAIEQQREDNREGFAQLNVRLDRLVPSEAFSAEQRRVDDRLKDLADDITSERQTRQAAIAAEQKSREEADNRLQVSLDKMIATQRWVVAAILLPVFLFAATLFINLRGS